MEKPEVQSPGPAPRSAEALAIERTLLALDRTLLAWNRTSLTLITFGFTVYHLLQYMKEVSGVRVLRPESPRNLALFFECLGTFSLLFVALEYLRQRKALLPTERRRWLHAAFLSAVAICLFGLFLLITLLFNLSLL